MKITPERTEYNRLYYQAHKTELLKYALRYRVAHKTEMKYYSVKRHYGLTVEEYDTLLMVSGGSCYICGITPEEEGQNGLHVDHDAQTGVVRGMLCPSCNLMLGKAHHNTQILESAIKYLEGGPLSVS